MIERMAVKPTKETVRQFCARFEDAYEGACLRESWPYVREEILNKPGAIGAFCSAQPNAEEEQACYDTAFSVVGRQTLGISEQALRACGGVAEDRKDECYGRVALAYLEEDRGDGESAIAFCTGAYTEGRDSCVQFLAERAAFVFGKDEVLLWKFCKRVPGSLRAVCMKNPEQDTSLSGAVHTQRFFVR